MAQVRAEVRITGRVQGVWFRQSTKQIAEKYAVNGWCRNKSDNSVEAVFEGDESSVRAVVDWCRYGPELARVEDLQLTWENATGEFSDFRVR